MPPVESSRIPDDIIAELLSIPMSTHVEEDLVGGVVAESIAVLAAEPSAEEETATTISNTSNVPSSSIVQHTDNVTIVEATTTTTTTITAVAVPIELAPAVIAPAATVLSSAPPPPQPPRFNVTARPQALAQALAQVSPQVLAQALETPLPTAVSTAVPAAVVQTAVPPPAVPLAFMPRPVIQPIGTSVAAPIALIGVTGGAAGGVAVGGGGGSVGVQAVYQPIGLISPQYQPQLLQQQQQQQQLQQQQQQQQQQGYPYYQQPLPMPYPVGVGMIPQYPGPLGGQFGGMPQQGGPGGPQYSVPMGVIPLGGMGGMMAPPVVGDPNNDMNSWSEHESEDTRKYWYNRVTGTSTYNKPFCLKTPEERSIPNCKWKEYTSADDKKYYSDGKESSWSVPEEYRIWKERVDAVEKKKADLIANNGTNNGTNKGEKRGINGNNGNNGANNDLKSSNSNSNNSNNNNGNSNNSNNNNNSNSGNSSSSHGRRKHLDDDKPDVAYATQDEAVEAFKSMLQDKKVLTTMKIKEVTDFCQSDSRFKALKTAGERKQALAEYQTRSLKLEKEAQKSKARKSRDLFLIMLAENTGIDARTRFRDAVQLLQEDVRFINVEGQEREDLFNDFVGELEKKEKEDRLKNKSSALAYIKELLITQENNGELSRKNTWAIDKDNYLKIPELRALEEYEVKRIFLEHVGKLDQIYKDKEKEKKMIIQKKLDILTREFREILEKLAFDGVLSAKSRWQECSKMTEIIDCHAYGELELLLRPEKSEKSDRNDREKGEKGDRNDKNGGREGSRDSGFGSSSLGGMGGGGGMGVGSARDTFDKVLLILRETARADKRLIQDVLSDWQFEVHHMCTLQEFRDTVYVAAGVNAKSISAISGVGGVSGNTVQNSLDTSGNNGSNSVNSSSAAVGVTPATSAVTITAIAAITEDGEELEENVEDRSKSGFGKQLRSMLAKRPFAVDNTYAEIIEEEIKRFWKREERFLLLLEECSLENPNVLSNYDEMKRMLCRHSEYIEIGKNDREKVYDSFITKKLEQKAKRKLEGKNDEKNEKGERIERNDSRDRKEGRERRDSKESRDGRDGREDLSHDTRKHVVGDKRGRESREGGRESREGRDRKLSDGEISTYSTRNTHHNGSNQTISESKPISPSENILEDAIHSSSAGHSVSGDSGIENIDRNNNNHNSNNDKYDNNENHSSNAIQIIENRVISNNISNNTPRIDRKRIRNNFHNIREEGEEGEEGEEDEEDEGEIFKDEEILKKTEN